MGSQYVLQSSCSFYGSRCCLMDLTELKKSILENTLTYPCGQFLLGKWDQSCSEIQPGPSEFIPISWKVLRRQLYYLYDNMYVCRHSFQKQQMFFSAYILFYFQHTFLKNRTCSTCSSSQSSVSSKKFGLVPFSNSLYFFSSYEALISVRYKPHFFGQS